MCYAIPGKIIRIEAETATVDYGGVRKQANISLVKCSIGDFVLVHAGFAIQLVDADVAQKTWSTLEGLA